MSVGRDTEGSAVISRGAPTLEVKGLTKAYGEVKALRGVDLVVEGGTLTSLLGPSGCGKTTTLQIIAGFVGADAGTVTLGGRPIDDLPAHKRNIGVVFQEDALFSHMTVYDNVAFGLKMRRVAREERNERVRNALDLVRLADMDARYTHELSGGQQQRVALARAIVIEPSVLLLDEPLSSLDRNLREALRLEIQRVQDTIGTTTVYVTHDQEEAMALSDVVAIMDDGAVLQSGSPETLYQRPATPFVADFLAVGNLVPGTVAAATDDGETIVTLDGLGEFGIPAGMASRSEGDPVVAILSRTEVTIEGEPWQEPAPRNHLVGTVEMTEFLGLERLIVMRVGDTVIALRTPTSNQIRPTRGDLIRASWNKPGAIRLVKSMRSDAP